MEHTAPIARQVGTPAAGAGPRPFANRNPLAAYETFGRFLVPTLAFLVESFEHMGKPGEARLRPCDRLLRPASGQSAVNRATVC